MNSVYVVNKKSQRSMVTMMAGAISNCLMNYFFIKWWGPIGATYASLSLIHISPFWRATRKRSPPTRPSGCGSAHRRAWMTCST